MRTETLSKSTKLTQTIWYFFLVWDDFGEAFTAPQSARGGRSFGFRYHYYSLPDGPQLPGTVKLQMLFHGNEAKRIQTARMLMETFAPGRQVLCSKEGLRRRDTFLQSWAVWEWKTFCRETNFIFNSSQQEQWGEFGLVRLDGKPWNNVTNRPYQSKEMARTYAYAVGGNITSMKFSGEGRAANANGDGSFSLAFALNTSIKMPTEIFVSSEYYYPNGFNVTVDPPSCFTQAYNHTSRILKLFTQFLS